MSKLRIVLALALIVLISTSAGAQSVWDGGAGTDNWNDADNWSPDGIPAAGDTAQFAGASPYAVTVGSPSTVGTLSFTAGDYTLGGTGDLTMSTLLSSSGVNALDTKLAGTLSGSSISGGTLSLNNTENTLSGSISVEAGATLVAKADDSGSSLGTATAVLNGGTLTARSLLPPLPTGTLAYWDMEATDAGAVIDASGNGNNATINGDASLVAGAGGKYGQAATFDGSGDYLEVETDLLKNLQQDYTIATWFNLGSSSSYPRLWSNKMNNYNDPRGISIEHKNTEELAVWAGDSKVTNGADGLDVGNWHHVAVTIDKLDGGGHEVVVTYDGTQVASETLDDGDMQDSENFFSLARQAFGGDDYDGLLDDFIVLDRVLTQTEIQDLMAGIGGGPVAAAGEFGNDIDLTADSEIVAEGDVNFGSLTMDAGTTLTTSAYDANGGSVTFTDTTPAGNAGFVANVDTALGALALQDNATITKSGAAILAATTATLNGSAAFDVTGGDVVLGATTAGGTLSKSGAGTLSLSDLGNSLSGANLVINDGTLLTDSNAATTSIVGASVTLDGGTLSLGGDGVYANTMTVLSESAIAAEGAPTLSSTITATGMTLNKTGAGNLHLTDTSNNVAVWNIQEGGLWVDANGNQPTAVQGSLIKLTGDGTTMVFDNVQPNDTTATVTNDVLVELADGESARISTDRPGEDSWNHVVIDGTVTAGTADGTGTATLVLRSGRRSKTIVNGALNLTSDLVLDVQSRETNGRGAIHGGIHDGGNGYDLVFDSSTNDYLPGLMDIDGNSTASGTLTMIGGNDGGNAGQLRLLNPGEWSNVVVDGSDVEMLVYDPNAFASTATVTLRNGGSIGAMYDVPASSDAAPAELSINVEKFIVEATGGELYMPNSGSSDDGFIIGDTDLNGRLTIASGGGGNAIGGGLAGTLTLAQDTTADTAVYTTSNHNGDDFIWAKITDGAGTAGNALRLGASGKAALNIFDPNSDYAGGTIIEAGGSKVIAMEDASLGTGDLTVLSGGRIILRDAADNLAPGATVLVENGAAVGVDTNQDITGQIDAASAGVYAVEGTYTHDIDQSTLGNGEMFVGSIDGGEVTGQVLAGADDTIRLGGGDTAGNLGRLTITGDDRLTGTSSVQIGGSAAELGAGNGTYVEINGNNSYTGGTDVVSGTLAIAGGVTPFGSGDVNVYSGATIAASGSDGTFVGYAGGEIVINPGATLLLDGNPRPGAAIREDFEDASNVNEGRWGNNTDITLVGGTLRMTTGMDQPWDESVGVVNYGGRSLIATHDATRGTTELGVAGLNRLGRGVLAVSDSDQDEVGTKNVYVASNAAPSMANGMIAPHIIWNRDTYWKGYASNYDFAKLVAVDRDGDGTDEWMRIAPVSSYVSDFASATATSIVQNSNEETLTADKEIWALKQGGTINVGSHTLTLGSGGLILPNRDRRISSDKDGSGYSTGSVDFGSAEGMIWVFTDRSAHIYAGLQGSNGVTFGGAGGDVRLHGRNTYAGETWINGTIVRVGNDNGFVTNGLPSSTRLTLASGGLLDINTIEGDTQQLDGLAGDGTVELGGNTLQIGDELAPGLSVGKLTIAEAGQVNLGSLTVSTFELKSATRFDQLVLEEATMELGGALTVNLIDGYDPEVGTMFHLIQGDANGVFDTLTTDSSLAMLPFYDPENMDPGVYARATYVGDANLDNKVSLADLSALAGNWNSTDATWEEGDFNGDGKVSLADLSALAGNWNIGVSNAGSMPLTNVPEPATLSLLAMGGLATLIRRKRK